MVLRLAIIIFSLLSPSIFAAAISIDDFYIRQPLPTKTLTSGYGKLSNTTNQEMTLVAVSCNCAKAVEIHQHIKVEGMMRMQHIPRLVIPKQEQIVLQPGGFHLMLFEIQPNILNSTPQLTFEFADGTHLTQSVSAKSLFDE